MSWFDSSTFAQAVLEGARAKVALALATDAGAELDVRLDELERDVKATLAALEIERDSRRLHFLRQDLELFLPARRVALVSAARSVAASDAQAAFEAALDVASAAILAVARSFVTRGL